MTNHHPYPPPKLIEYVRWCALHIRLKKYESRMKAVHRARELQWRVDHLEKLIMQNTPKSDWQSVYGIYRREAGGAE